jgi:hypothetical protein
MIMNPFSCENCKEELQPENIGVNVNEKGELVRICLFCGNEVIVK